MQIKIQIEENDSEWNQFLSVEIKGSWNFLKEIHMSF